MVCSLYLQVGIGLAPANLAMLADVGEAAAREGVPIIVGGDFNFGPATLRAAAFHTRAHATIVAPKAPTCLTKSSATVIDYFVVSDAIEPMS